jgi:hypothetical protein
VHICHELAGSNLGFSRWMARSALCVAIFEFRDCDQEAVARLIGNAGLMRSTGVKRAISREGVRELGVTTSWLYDNQDTKQSCKL